MGKRERNSRKQRHRVSFAYVFPERKGPADKELNPALPVQTRSGLPARLISFDVREHFWAGRAVIQAKGKLNVEVTKTGSFYRDPKQEDQNDLFNVSLEDWNKVLGRKGTKDGHV